MPSRICFAMQDGQHLNLLKLRRAFVSFLLAKKTRGTFIFRIENIHDKKQFELNKPIHALDQLNWLGLLPDESPLNPNSNFAPYVQNERLAIYTRYAESLLSSGAAYKKTIANENNLAGNLHSAIYLKMTGISEGFSDLLRGKISSNQLNTDDWVIFNSDGSPSSQFARIIDDHLMNITHVVSEERYLPNVSKYLSLCRALNWTYPFFIHLPDMKNSSEVNDMQLVTFLHNEGYLPEAILNYLYQLDINETDKGKILSLSDIVNAFEIKNLHFGKRVFTLEALQKINGLLIKNTNDVGYRTLVRPFISSFVNETFSDEYLFKLAFLYKTQISYGAQLNDYFAPFLMSNPNFTPAELQLINSPESQAVVKALKTRLETEDETLENIKAIISDVQKTTCLSGKSFFLPIRLLLTRLSHGAEIDEIIKFLGKEEVLRRLCQDKD